MTWILFIWFNSIVPNDKVGKMITTQEFNSLQACIDAADAIYKQTWKLDGLAHVCVKK